MTNDRTRFEEALNRGHSLSWDQQWREAIAAFNDAVSEMPDEPAPYAGLGMAYLEMGDMHDALENYKMAARYSRGNIIYLRKVADMQERLELNSEAGKTYMAIGEMELSRRNLPEAMDNWHRAVNLEPNLLRAHQRLASIYQRQGASRNAIQEYLAIAKILQMEGEQAKALQACQLALQLDPRNPEILTAIELVKQGQPLFENEEPVSTPAEKEGTGLLNRVSSEIDKDARNWQPGKLDLETAVPVQDARRMAMEQLAMGIFSEDDDALDANKLQLGTLISQALDYQRRGMLNEAISSYEQAIRDGEDSAAVHFNLGLLYQDKLRFEDAIREFEKAVHDRDYHLAGYFALGESYRARGNVDKSVENFIQVLKIVDLATVRHNEADRLIQLYENLADSLVTKGEREQATNFANALVDFLSHRGWEDKAKQARERLNTISDAGMMILGDVMTAGSEQVLESLYLSQEYTKRAMYNTAIEESYRAIQLSPDYLPAHIQLGEVLAKQGRSDVAALKFTTVADTFRIRGDINGALLAYERVVAISPLDLSVRTRLIEMLKRHGQIDRAMEHYAALGDAYYQLAQVDKSREVYQEALKLAPRSADEIQWRVRILRKLADIDMQRFDWRRSLASYKELRELDPLDEWTAMTLVSLHYRVGQPNNAIRELDKYLKQLVQGGRSNKVVGILEDMIQQQAGDANLVDRLTRIYLQQGRTEDVIAVLDKLGESQLEAGNREAAVITIEKIVKLNPANVSDYEHLLTQLR